VVKSWRNFDRACGLVMALVSLTHAEFELAGRRMGSGRTRPILVSARTADETPVQLVIKARNRLVMPPSEYLFEWLGAAVASALGIEVPAAFAVTIDRKAAQSVMDPELRQDLEQSVGLIYGAEFVGDRGQTQLPDGLKPTRAQRDAAARVLGFDVFIHNPDRRSQNHNLFVHREGVIAFDHEAAFSFLLPVLFAPDPVLDPCSSIISQHALLGWLRGYPEAMAEFGRQIQSLDEVFWTTLAALTPAEWTQGQAASKLGMICDVLRRRRDALQSWLPQVMACLDR
jgi:hypothetical protein